MLKYFLNKYFLFAVCVNSVVLSIDVTLEATPTNVNNSFTDVAQRKKQEKTFTARCHQHYTSNCLKLDMARVLMLLRRLPAYDILPGVLLSSQDVKYKPKIFPDNPDRMDDYLQDEVKEYLKSLTLQVQVYNEDALDYIEKQQHVTETGRTKKAKFLSIYTVFAIAFALLSALVGKAMTLSIVSLVIAMIARNAGAGNTPPATPPIYDIVRRPQIQYSNTQSQEDIYEAAHAGMPVSYAAYPRQGRDLIAPYFGWIKLKNNKIKTDKEISN